MKKLGRAIMLAVSLMSFQACSSKKAENDSVENAEKKNDAKEDAGTGQNDETTDFAVKAANGGMLEIAVAKLGEEKAMSKDIKDASAMIIKDHEKANEELKTIAQTQNITLPTTLGEDAQKKVDDLAKLSGKDFDEKFISMMKSDHKDDVDEFKKASTDDKTNPAVKDFAAKTLPTLQKHLDMIEAIDKKM